MSEPTRKAARVFDEWAKQGRDEGMEQRHILTGGPILDQLDLDGARFLDLGCGNGWASRWATDHGATAIGVDVAPTMLERTPSTTQAGFVKASFEKLPLPAGSFDVAFSMEALYYAKHLQAALRETLRVLAPGASLHALLDYYEENPESHGWPQDTGLPMHRLSEEEWSKALEQAGFQDVGTQRVRIDDETVADWKSEHGSLHVHGTRPP